MPGQTSLWDRLIDSARRRASTKASACAPAGCRSLSLRGIPEPRFRPNKPRELAAADPAALAVVRACCEGRRPWPLLLHGPAGTGKTCLLLALCDHAAGYFADFAELVEKRREYVCGRDLSFSWPDLLKYARLIACDELAVRGPSEFAFETLKLLLDGREGTPLAFASNLDLDRLAAVYDDRIASRLAAGTVLYLGGADRRLAGAG